MSSRKICGSCFLGKSREQNFCLNFSRNSSALLRRKPLDSAQRIENIHPREQSPENGEEEGLRNPGSAAAALTLDSAFLHLSFSCYKIEIFGLERWLRV